MLNRTCVSIDLETTGLDPEADRIIEIGAVKFRGAEVIDTFHTLLNPNRPLPHRVRLITGITADELEPAPDFSEVADQLLRFVGDCTVVGQNVSFDLGFLQSEGLGFPGPVYDVLELASILLPRLLDYSLPRLAEQLGVSCPVHHRALDDAMTAKDVFLALLEKVAGLELPLIAEVNRLTMATDWSWRSIFVEAERSKESTVSLWDRETWEEDFAPLSVDLAERKPLVPSQEFKPVDWGRLSSLLVEAGPMSQAFPAYEYRAGQVAMMEEVARALNSGRHLIVEAGTGTGKSMAYLLPAIFFAVANNVPVVVSTNTINLQEQLVNKDIPDLLRALDGGAGDLMAPDLEVAQLKGRSNYLCIRRWNTWRKTPGLAWEDIRFLLRILLWLSSTSSGDRAELNLNSGESYLWNRVCASEDNCVAERCPYYPSGCFLYRARHRTEGAHLIVVNHALLLSDLGKKGGVLPDYRHLVVDEAHHLEEEATEQLGYRVGDREVADCLQAFGDRGGFVYHLRNYLRTTSLARVRRNDIDQQVEALQDEAKSARGQAAQLFDAVRGFLTTLLGKLGEYESHLRLANEVRRHPRWTQVELPWENLKLGLGSLEAGLSRLYSMMDDLPNRRSPDLNACLAEISSLRQQIDGLRSRIDSIIASPEAGTIYWASARAQGGVNLHAAPLRVGQLLDDYLYSQKDCVVLTSATLSTGDNFDYVRESLGLSEAGELALEAPFDYETSTLICLPLDMPEPDNAGYQKAAEQLLAEVSSAIGGRTLALFTSHAALRAVHAGVQPRLEEEDILVLGQGVDGSPRRVLDYFKATPRALLLGTSSLWEGVDVVGKALSVLAIARLPFSVPTDPVISARSELYDDPFNQYLVPQAILKFKQGFGRLIRSRSDRGVVIVLDKRLQTKAYGRVFLQSLPRCTLRSGALRDIPQEVLDWLKD